MPKAILQDPESYENMRNSIGILKLLSQGEDDLKNNKISTQDDVFATIEYLKPKVMNGKPI